MVRSVILLRYYTINTYKENRFLWKFFKIIIFSIEIFPWHLASMSVVNYSTDNNHETIFLGGGLLHVLNYIPDFCSTEYFLNKSISNESIVNFSTNIRPSLLKRTNYLQNYRITYNHKYEKNTYKHFKQLFFFFHAFVDANANIGICTTTRNSHATGWNWTVETSPPPLPTRG